MFGITEILQSARYEYVYEFHFYADQYNALLIILWLNAFL